MLCGVHERALPVRARTEGSRLGSWGGGGGGRPRRGGAELRRVSRRELGGGGRGQQGKRSQPRPESSVALRRGRGQFTRPPFPLCAWPGSSAGRCLLPALTVSGPQKCSVRPPSVWSMHGHWGGGEDWGAH